MKIISSIYFCISIILLLATNCGSDSKKVPPGIIPSEQMVAILAEFQLAEATFQLNLINRDSLSASQNQILSIHQVSKQEFDTSFSYYSTHPEIMEKVYEEVINELSRRQAEAVKKK